MAIYEPGYELNEEQKEILQKLVDSNKFKDIMLYNGDDELISSINAEYHFDPADIILTDGCMNIATIPWVQGGTNINALGGVRATLGIRGASFLIICDNNTGEVTLRMDTPKLKEKYDLILAFVDQLEKNREDMDYYIRSWRSNALPNPCTMNDIYKI